MNTSIRRALALLTICLVAVPALSQQEPAPAAVVEQLSQDLRDAIDAAVREEMDRQELVGVAVGVIRDGTVAYTAGYGYADREEGVPVTNDTLFRWASISKPVTAVAAMQLVETGTLDLRADIREHVPEFPGKGAPITTEQLLAHLGGIVHYTNGPVIRTQREYDTPNPYESVILALDTFAPSPLVNQPGERYSYSTRGYILASAVVERAGEQPFAQQVQERICEPLGLTTLQPDYQWVDIPNRAKGYRMVRGHVFPSTDTDVSWKLGGGGFISNVHDLARFAAALMNSELVNEATTQDMWTPRTDANGESSGYGLGLRATTSNGQLRIMHTGSQEKTRTRMVFYPEAGHGIVVMTNSEHGDCGAISTAMYQVINAIREAEPTGQ